MSSQVFLKINAVGYRTVFSDIGVPLVFKNGVCPLTDEQADDDRLADFIRREGKGYGISLMSQEEVAERAKIAEQEAAAAAKKAEYQGQIDAIIRGVDPQLIQAEKPAVQTLATSATVGQSATEKIAQAKAAAAAKSN